MVPMQISTILDMTQDTRLMFILYVGKNYLIVRPISSRGLKMAHDGLLNRSIVAGGEVLELVTTVNQGRRWGEFPGGKS